MNLEEEKALAKALIDQHGETAATHASELACTQASMGDEESAARWRRVVAFIAAKQGAGSSE